MLAPSDWGCRVIARWLRRWLVGDPCSLCSLPVRPERRGAHLEWHRTEALMAGRPAASSVNPRPVRPARPPQPRRGENGGPT